MKPCDNFERLKRGKYGKEENGESGEGGALAPSRATPENRVGGKLTPTLSGFEILNKTTCIIQNWLFTNILYLLNFTEHEIHK